MSKAPPLQGSVQKAVYGGGFELGVHEELKLEADKKPPAWKRKRALGLYIFFAGALLPALFMGFGNEFICPFTVPGGQDRDVCCDTLGARKAAILYTVLCMFYGIVIGYSAKQLIQRTGRGLAVWIDHRRYTAKHGTEGMAERLKNENADRIRQKHFQKSEEIRKDLIQTERKMMEMKLKAVLLGGSPTPKEQQLQRNLEVPRQNTVLQTPSLQKQFHTPQGLSGSMQYQGGGQAQQGQSGSMQFQGGGQAQQGQSGSMQFQGGGQAQQVKPGQMPIPGGGMQGPQGDRFQQGQQPGPQQRPPQGFQGGGHGGQPRDQYQGGGPPNQAGFPPGC